MILPCNRHQVFQANLSCDEKKSTDRDVTEVISRSLMKTDDAGLHKGIENGDLTAGIGIDDPGCNG